MEPLLRYIYRLKKMKIKPLKHYLLYTSTDVVTISKETYKLMLHNIVFFGLKKVTKKLC